MTVRRRPLPASVFWLCAFGGIIGGAVAQEKPAPPPEPEEVEVLATGQKEIGAFAALAAKSGFPVRAKQAWLEVIGEYASDDEAARKALGWIRSGSVWQRDAKFEYPGQDQPDAGAARMLEQRWQQIATRLGPLHRAVAEKLAAAGKKERADYHVQRALRFVPNDAKAMAQGGLRQFEGITGDDVDVAVLTRSRLMDRTLTKLVDQSFPATVLTEKLPMLDAAGIAYQGVKSEHFAVYGDLELDVLQQAAAWAERSLAFCQEAFAGFEGFPPKGQPSTKLVFLKTKETWAQLVRKTSKVRDVEFIVQNANATELDGNVETAAVEQPAVVYDFAVRWIVQDYSGMTVDALQEGIGHAVVGMFFGRNLVFSIGQQDPKATVAGGRTQSKFLLPDMDTWKELAIEIAWQQGSTPAAHLPLLKAAQFPSEARIKAWSFCDYLLRRDPNLLTQLQRTISKAHNDDEVRAAFQQFTGQSLQTVEERWRRFWTEDSPLRRAVVNKVTPLEAASREAPAWLEMFNKLREQCGQKPVGWSAQLSIACKEHVDYLKANKDQRGPDKENTELAGKPAYSQSGRAFAPSAVVWTGALKKAAESWLLLPGYRDAIVDANIDTVGIYAESGVVVLDASRGRVGGNQVKTQVWPEGSQGGRAKAPVPAAVDVDLLGPEVQQLLAANNRGKQKQVGFPLTLHTYNANLPDCTCKVTCQGEVVPGFLVLTKGSIRRTSAPGMWVFWPAEPWKRGVDIRAEWTWTNGQHTVTFLAN